MKFTKTYINQVEINGQWYSNIIEAKDYKEALEKHREQKRKSRNRFRERLSLSN